MKKAIIFLPTMFICGIYRFLSFIFFKLKKPSKRRLYFDKYEDKLFTIFTPYVISPSFFRPKPSKNYMYRHGLYKKEAEQEQEAEFMRRVFEKWSPEQQKMYLDMKGSSDYE